MKVANKKAKAKNARPDLPSCAQKPTTHANIEKLWHYLVMVAVFMLFGAVGAYLFYFAQVFSDLSPKILDSLLRIGLIVSAVTLLMIALAGLIVKLLLDPLSALIALFPKKPPQIIQHHDLDD